LNSTIETRHINNRWFFDQSKPLSKFVVNLSSQMHDVHAISSVSKTNRHSGTWQLARLGICSWLECRVTLWLCNFKVC